MTATDLSKNVLYKKFKVFDGKERMFHCSVAFSTKREADAYANDARKTWGQPCRIVKGKHGLYYPYIHGEE